MWPSLAVLEQTEVRVLGQMGSVNLVTELSEVRFRLAGVEKFVPKAPVSLVGDSDALAEAVKLNRGNLSFVGDLLDKTTCARGCRGVRGLRLRRPIDVIVSHQSVFKRARFRLSQWSLGAGTRITNLLGT